MDDNDSEYVNEYVNQISCNKYFYKKKPTNALDYIKFHSENYEKFKIEERVKEKINGLIFEIKYIQEIIDITFLYFKKLKDSIRLTDIISIVTYKLIKKYHLTLTHSEIFKFLNLNKSSYLKYSNLINLSSINDENHLEEDYTYRFIKYTNFLLNSMHEYFKFKPNAIKIQTDKISLQECIENVNHTTFYLDTFSQLDLVKKKVRELITKNTFYSYFNNKILMESLSAATVRYIMNSKGILINLKIFKEFSLSISNISKASKMLNQYVKINNIQL